MPLRFYEDAIFLLCTVVRPSSVLHIVSDQALKIVWRYDRAVCDSSTYLTRMISGRNLESIAACQHNDAYFSCLDIIKELNLYCRHINVRKFF